MTQGLVRYQQSKHLHFVTFSCFHRQPHLHHEATCDLFLLSLERMRLRYCFSVCGYVVMPEHVHLLLAEPAEVPLAKVIQAINLSVAVRREERPFWQARYYDFNVFTRQKYVEKLRYIHRNPVTRGLVETPEQWRWSSFEHYASNKSGIVHIDAQ